MDCIYLDNNATTPLLPAVWEGMRPYLCDVYGNPASSHRAGRRARQALEDARENLAAILGAHPDEVIFTSGATEANNLALFGLFVSPGHVVASPLEHPSVAEPLRQLAGEISWLPVSADGAVPVSVLPGLLRPDTRLVTAMLANHETGAVQPVRALVEAVGARAPFHCDAVQAVGKLPVHFHELGVTTLALSAHKFHGPKGIGALLVRRGAKLRPRTYGGHQQRGLRPGTENVALAVGMALALTLAARDAEERRARVRLLRHSLLEYLRANAAPIVLNGPEEGGVPHTLNLSFPGLRADAFLMALDLAGVACSTGSACSSGSLLPSPVLQAMGTHDEVLRSAMRFSLSALLTPEEVAEAARRIAHAAERLRRQASAG